jgi:hypothetical protein
MEKERANNDALSGMREWQHSRSEERSGVYFTRTFIFNMMMPCLCQGIAVI